MVSANHLSSSWPVEDKEVRGPRSRDTEFDDFQNEKDGRKEYKFQQSHTTDMLLTQVKKNIAFESNYSQMKGLLWRV